MGLKPKERRIIHLIRRAQKWYKVDLTKNFRLELGSKIQDGEYKKKTDSYWGRSVCIVTCRGVTMFVVVDHSQRLITILPPQNKNDHKHRKQRYVNRRRF